MSVFKRVRGAIASGNTCVHVCVFCTRMPPLEAIHRAQVPFFPLLEAAFIQEFPGTVGVPDLHPLLRQLLGVRGTLDHRNNTEQLGPRRSGLGQNTPMVNNGLGRILSP